MQISRLHMLYTDLVSWALIPSVLQLVRGDTVRQTTLGWQYHDADRICGESLSDPLSSKQSWRRF